MASLLRSTVPAARLTCGRKFWGRLLDGRTPSSGPTSDQTSLAPPAFGGRKLLAHSDWWAEVSDFIKLPSTTQHAPKASDRRAAKHKPSGPCGGRGSLLKILISASDQQSSAPKTSDQSPVAWLYLGRKCPRRPNLTIISRLAQTRDFNLTFPPSHFLPIQSQASTAGWKPSRFHLDTRPRLDPRTVDECLGGSL